MSKTARDNTELQIGDKTYTLVSTLKAAKRIESLAGNLSAAYRDVEACSLTRIAQVIAAGAGLNLKPKEVEALEEEIFAVGIMKVMTEVKIYLLFLINPVVPDEDEESEGGGVKETPAPKAGGKPAK